MNVLAALRRPGEGFPSDNVLTEAERPGEGFPSDNVLNEAVCLGEGFPSDNVLNEAVRPAISSKEALVSLPNATVRTVSLVRSSLDALVRSDSDAAARLGDGTVMYMSSRSSSRSVKAGSGRSVRLVRSGAGSGREVSSLDRDPLLLNVCWNIDRYKHYLDKADRPRVTVIRHDRQALETDRQTNRWPGRKKYRQTVNSKLTLHERTDRLR